MKTARLLIAALIVGLSIFGHVPKSWNLDYSQMTDREALGLLGAPDIQTTEFGYFNYGWVVGIKVRGVYLLPTIFRLDRRVPNELSQWKVYLPIYWDGMLEWLFPYDGANHP